MTDKDNKAKPKSINIDQVVSYLTHAFAENTREAFGVKAKATRTSELGSPLKGTPLYWTQIEFCYLIDQIQRGPTYMLPKVISTANDFIASIQASDIPEGV